MKVSINLKKYTEASRTSVVKIQLYFIKKKKILIKQEQSKYTAKLPLITLPEQVHFERVQSCIHWRLQPSSGSLRNIFASLSTVTFATSEMQTQPPCCRPRGLIFFFLLGGGGECGWYLHFIKKNTQRFLLVN